MKKHTTSSLLTLAAALLLSACGGSSNDASQNSEASSDPTQSGLATLFLNTAPPDPKTVGAVIESGTPGEIVAVSGQIGGAVDPFVEGYAVFFLGDESLLFCDEMPDHNCPTPWDACCEDPDKITENRLLVQFSDESGTVLPISLGGENGLKGLENVVVTGELIESDGGGLMIEAAGIYRIEEDPAT